MSVEEALLQCRMSVKKAGKIVEKAVLSVRSNASHNHGLDQSKLYLAQIYAGKGRYRKTVDQKAKGRSVLKKKYYSHLTVRISKRERERERERDRQFDGTPRLKLKKSVEINSPIS